ncbi:hypothetical protein PN409_08150 [Halorubrum ezzemoulense]|nr:hypothetical protein [Halorubrum ezzemoulense]MDB9233902.1 hypothetical protein [Halorubrum ezzemoulense]
MFTDAAYAVSVPDSTDGVSIQDPIPSDVETVQVGVSSDLSNNVNYLNVSIDNQGSGDSYVSVPIEDVDAGEINTIDISDLDLSTTGPTPTLTPELVEGSTNTVNSGSGVQVTDVTNDAPSAVTTEGEVAFETSEIRADETTLLAYAGPNGTTTSYDQINITNTANGNTVILEEGVDYTPDSEFTADISSLDTSENDQLEVRTEDSNGNVAGTDPSATKTIAAPIDVASVENLNPGEFAVGSDGAFLADPVLDDQNQYTILLNPSSGAFADEEAFGESDDATLDLVSPAGATTQVELTAPDLFSEQGEAVRL